MSSGEPPEQFEFHVSLTPEEVAASFKDDARIEWTNGPAGSFAPPDKQFQAWAQDASRMVIRHAVRETRLGASPNVHIEWSQSPTGGTLVRGVFRKRAGRSNDRFIRIATPIMAALGVAYVLAVDASKFLWAVGAVLASIAVYRASSNRPTARSMLNFGHGLWQIVGEKFVPHALGTGESTPFRSRALPPDRRSGS